jgi:hypothetical protein
MFSLSSNERNEIDGIDIRTAVRGLLAFNVRPGRDRGYMDMGWLTLIATVLATVVSPLIAVQVSIALGRRKEQRDRQLQLFRTLMLTRDALLSPEHVRALNTIEIDFHGDKRAKSVLDAWHAYYQHLNLPLLETDEERVAWAKKRIDLLTTLLEAMGKFLGYAFESEVIRSIAYTPRVHSQLNDEQTQMRQLVMELLRNQRALAIAPVTLPGTT